MALTMIKGRFRVVGASPDGDSVRFYADDPTAYARANIKVRLNGQGGAQLRLDGIDALETHYAGWHQQSELGGAGAKKLLDHLGIKNVRRDSRGTVTSARPAEVPGYIMTRFADKYGRAVAFAFKGAPPEDEDDGDLVFLDVERMRRSANHMMLESGLAYPTFYSLLYVDLRNAMAEAANKARAAEKGVWRDDLTTTGYDVTGRDQLSELVIVPKLFRRLVDYVDLDETGGVALDGFAHYLDTRNDRLFTVPDGHSTELATLVEVDGQHLRLTVPPERIVFVEA
jgi:endonuclease YncB( thermonuclease family)